MTLIFDGWPRKKQYLFFTTSSFVPHFKPIGKFKLDSQSSNARFGYKLANILSHQTLKFDGWSCKIIGALLLYYVKFCTPLQSDRLIETRNIVQKCAIWVKISDFIAPYDLAFWEMTLKTIGHIFDASSSFVCHFITISELKLESQTKNAQFESKSMFFVLCDLEI